MLPSKINIYITVSLLILILFTLFISLLLQTNLENMDSNGAYATPFDEDADELAAKNKQNNSTNSGEITDEPNTKPANLTDPLNLPLREFMIMSSYDSVFDGKTPTINTLADVMHSGARFIDLNVFMSAKEKRLFVGPTKDINATSADLSLKLSEVLAYINQYAFVVDNRAKARAEIPLNERNIPGINKPAEGAPTLGNKYTEYPLFLNIRIQQTSPETDIIGTLYNDYLAGEKGLIDSKFRLVSGENATQINGDTKLRDLKGRIVITMDIDNILKNYAPTTMNALDVKAPVKEAIRKFVNIKTGGHTWHTYHSYNTIESLSKTTISPKGGDLTTDVKKMYVAYPGIKDTAANPNAARYLSEHGIQTTLMRFYLRDKHLDDYKTMFREFKTPMVPINSVLRKLTANK